MNKLVLTAAFMALALTQTATAGETPSAPGTTQYFVNLSDGDTVEGPVKVIFGLSGMGVAPAGVEKEFTGHHHILLNRPALGEGQEGAEELDYGIMADENNIHFGKGQTETVLDLPSGTHTLQLVLGDWSHVPHNPPVFSEVISITVE